MGMVEGGSGLCLALETGQGLEVLCPNYPITKFQGVAFVLSVKSTCVFAASLTPVALTS